MSGLREMDKSSIVVVSGGFDDLRSAEVRFLQEASRSGSLHVLLWSDETIRSIDGQDPKFPQQERLYLLESLRYVNRVIICRNPAGCDSLSLPEGLHAEIWVVDQTDDNDVKRAYCRAHGMQYRVLRREELQGFPDAPSPLSEASSAKRVIVSGCFDWFHSGHIRFFEEASQLGDLYVVVGHDANVKLLKGEGHPMFSADERRYLVQSVRYVKQALISSGNGWLDAEPQIQKIKPHLYVVNEDGDRPEKRRYCETHGIEYRVLKRIAKQGLPRRQSKDLRGF
jgi:cytidyltransferase-like protein